MEDDEDLLEVQDTTPATDPMARILNWVGLIGGLGLCLWLILDTLA